MTSALLHQTRRSLNFSWGNHSVCEWKLLISIIGNSLLLGGDYFNVYSLGNNCGVLWNLFWDGSFCSRLSSLVCRFVVCYSILGYSPFMSIPGCSSACEIVFSCALSLYVLMMTLIEQIDLEYRLLEKHTKIRTFPVGIRTICHKHENFLFWWLCWEY